MAEHASSHFSGDGSANFVNRLAFSGGSYPSMGAIKVGDYVSALALGDPAVIFRHWKVRCHSRFQSTDYEA